MQTIGCRIKVIKNLNPVLHLSLYIYVLDSIISLYQQAKVHLIVAMVVALLSHT